MNSVTQKSPYPYYDVVLDRKEEKVTLCVYNGNGYGEYDHWEISKNGHKRVHKLTKNGYKQDYWQDYVHLEIIQNVYKVLDFYELSDIIFIK